VVGNDSAEQVVTGAAGMTQTPVLSRFLRILRTGVLATLRRLTEGFVDHSALWHAPNGVLEEAQKATGGLLTNTALRSALDGAGLSPRQLAYRVGVAPKQVERWLANAALTPHARNREDAARALVSCDPVHGTRGFCDR
jgi:hypothetical protein